MTAPWTGLAASAGFAVLLTILAWVYAPGVNGPALLDDISSVLVLETLRDHPEGIVDAVFSDHSGPLGRPVAIATFAAERAFLQGGIPLSKAINIGLHIANTVLWSLVFLRLLAPVNRSGSVIMVSLLSATLWAASPLLVSTVLYTVQRMAMLACFFMLLTILAYLGWRKAFLSGAPHLVRACTVLVLAFFAVFSKETGIVILPILLMLECLWFRWRNASGEPDRRLRNGCAGLVVLGGGVFATVFLLFPEMLLGSYRHFDFTAYERLSAQAGILWEYLMQIVLPDTGSMGLHHDDATIAEYAGDDGSNLGGILGWASLLLLAPLFYAHELAAKVLCCFLFFLVGHSTESTILPLELYYEHRNYFPAGAIFLLLALLLTRLVSAWPRVGLPVAVYLGLLWLLLASRTSALVQVWSSEPLLRVFHIAGHPDSYRANSDMASELASRGDLSAALEYSAIAQQLANESNADHLIRDLALSCMARQPLMLEERLGQDEGAETLRHLTDLNTMRVLIRYLQADACDENTLRSFSDSVWLAFGRTPKREEARSADLYTLLAILENANENFQRAMFYVNQLLQSRPDDVRGLLMRLHFATALGDEHLARTTREELLVRQKMNKFDATQRATLDLYLPAPGE